MSKKILLKKDRDDSQIAEKPKLQPKILVKASVKENVPAAIKKPEEEKKLSHMKSSSRILTNFQLESAKLERYLDVENTDFLVIAFIGTKNVGKSFLANLIAGNGEEVFSTERISNDTSIDCFITRDRIFCLDCSPLLLNMQKRDMVNAEIEELKLISLLFHVCHLIILVHDGFPNLSVSRLILQAESFLNFKHRPEIVSIGNKIQPGCKVPQFDTRIHEMSGTLLIPDLNHSSVDLHHDVSQIIQELQEKAYMKKRYSMIEDTDQVFTEQVWFKRLNSFVDQLKKGDYFYRKYEQLKDSKFHQSIEN